MRQATRRLREFTGRVRVWVSQTLALVGDSRYPGRVRTVPVILRRILRGTRLVPVIRVGVPRVLGRQQVGPRVRWENRPALQAEPGRRGQGRPGFTVWAPVILRRIPREMRRVPVIRVRDLRRRGRSVRRRKADHRTLLPVAASR
ncbi:hypothetical protein D5S18_23130 [Nocardia panacis]|uniref:Uncharacterized protein n=1 Tax=Nocardia panacis TaxID=2340916 RepID=A0A3A4K4Y3_9NOCA|nr:hypothetical protein [Nocardia panacis]RJO72075.1 hypothetical protein D5S18_23130 [Nocardia panacis]